MLRTCIRWVSRQDSSSRRHRQHPLPLPQTHGNAAAARRSQENSARSAEPKSPKTAGLVRPAEPRETKANSAPNAERRSPKAHRFSVAINAAGSLRIPRIRRSSVPNAATSSTITTRNNIFTAGKTVLPFPRAYTEEKTFLWQIL